MKMGQTIHTEKSYSSLYVYFNIVMYLYGIVKLIIFLPNWL